MVKMVLPFKGLSRLWVREDVEFFEKEKTRENPVEYG